MNFKKRRLLSRLNHILRTASIPEATGGKLEITDDEVLLDINGSFRRLVIYFSGNLFIYNNLPDGFSIKMTNNTIAITNLLHKNIRQDNIIFRFSGIFSPYKTYIKNISWKKINLTIIDNNRLELIGDSKTKFEDNSLLFLEEPKSNYSPNLIKSGIDDDSIKGLRSKTLYTNGVMAYYHYYPKDKIYMTGARPSKESLPIKRGTESYSKEEIRHIKSNIETNEQKRRKVLEPLKQLNPTKPTKLTKGGKY